jgi:hypothetical protein
MDSKLASFFILPAHCALAVGLLMTAAACGGGGDVPLAEARSARAEAAAATARVIPPLIHDDGSLAAGDPRAVPADAAAWTRSARYATAAQAQQLAHALGDGVLQVRVGCCGIDAVDEAAGIAWGLQLARELPADTPVLVSGTDLRLAAATANRLASGGLTHVWLVTTP